MGPFRVLWSGVADPELREGRLADVRGAFAVLVTSAVEVAPGEELRLELRDADDTPVSVGLAFVRSVEEQGLHVEILSFGIDVELLDAAGRPARKPVKPPPIPKQAPKPPPQPIPEPLDLDVLEQELEPLVEPLAVQRTGVIIGIDLGTTNTCASYVVDGRPKIIPGRTGTNTIPSMITFDPDGTFHIGQRAADRQVLYPLRTVYGSKRLIGRTYRAELASELQSHFAYPLAEAEGQRFGARIDDRVISMDTIAARVLDEVRGSAEAHLGQPVDAAIITVPAYFTEVQREAVRRAAAQAKLAVYRIVNEPTAAAVAYGHKQRDRARIAVWDFGGGTFDFSIVDVSDGQLEVLATGGDNFVGGSDFDDQLAGHLLSEFRRLEGIDFEPDPQQIARLREAAEHAKKMLSVEAEHLVSIPELTRTPRRDLEIEITREGFDALTRSLVERTVAIATGVMRAAGVSPTEIDDVLLVGGTTRIPAVQQSVADLFGRRPSKRINPDEAVAIGAALLAEEIGGGTAPALVDIIPMSVGRGVHGRVFEPIVKRYARVPSSEELVLDADLLGSVYVPLFQGESSDVAQNEYLCSVIVEDRSLWDGGRVVLRLSFDEHCVMTIDALDARTRRPLPVKLDRSRPVQDVLRDLGGFEGEVVEAWHPPPSPLGKVLGKLFKLFGRG
ncbi:MAG: Hsp70 family protein [Deltaproteobacteria bacterium]|nr:Hsp70 family protein [Deltaproteobacteria bacterium]